MEIKKNPKANLENYSKVLVLLGLVFALFVAYQGIEWKTFYSVDGLAHHDTGDDEDEEIPITQTQIEEIKPPPPPPPPPAAEEIVVVKDDKKIEETAMDAVDTDEDEEVKIEIVADDIEDEEEEEEIDEEIPFALIERVPVYPGCKGTNAELRKCMSKKINSHVSNKFDLELANELNLDPGNHRIMVGFTIDKNGNIINVRARAPHPRLEAEALRIVKTLPKMSPGKQRNKSVKVSYNLPIRFKIEDD